MTTDGACRLLLLSLLLSCECDGVVHSTWEKARCARSAHSDRLVEEGGGPA
ncbi:MAG: hypothetical protein INH37_00465 [Myxococcaceae bacterium]|nr:hypothetical protein [Myxococcaceae bacterium]